jgi:hypothetical protein
MAGIALIFKYQWRAFWRRMIRTRRRAQYYFMVLALLGWVGGVILPERLSRAVHELKAGQTSSMDAVLWTLCALWLFVVVEDTGISLTSQRLRTFPITIGRLLAVRVVSVFCSPVALLIALGSLISLWPFFSARHPVLGATAALLLFALALAVGMSASHVLSVAEWRRRLFVPAAIIGVVFGAFFLSRGREDIEQLQAAMAFTPPHFISAAAVADTPFSILIPLVSLLGIAVLVCSLLVWSFRRCLFSQPASRVKGRTAESVLWFPGRFGGLVRKEQYYFRKLLDVWPGLLLVIAVSVASLFMTPPPVIRQLIVLIVFVLNSNVIMNCLGMDTNVELNRYAIFPLSGQEVLFVKNLGLTMVIAGQLALLIVTAAWHSGFVEASVEIVVAAVLLLSHLTWGNVMSVSAPFKLHFYRFASNDAPVTAMVGSTLGSAPGVAVLLLLHPESSWSAAGIGAILLCVIATYVATLRYAGKRLEHRRHIIGERLA